VQELEPRSQLCLAEGSSAWPASADPTPGLSEAALLLALEAPLSIPARFVVFQIFCFSAFPQSSDAFENSWRGQCDVRFSFFKPHRQR